MKLFIDKYPFASMLKPGGLLSENIFRCATPDWGPPSFAENTNDLGLRMRIRATSQILHFLLDGRNVPPADLTLLCVPGIGRQDWLAGEWVTGWSERQRLAAR